MASVYSPSSLGIKPPPGGFQEGGWYQGRQYVGGTLSDPGVIHPSSTQIGAGRAVSNEVNAQSAKAQGTTPEKFNAFLESQRQQGSGVQPSGNIAPSASSFPGGPTDTGAGSFSGASLTPQPAINLPELYKSLVNSSGLTTKQAELAKMEQDFTEAKNKINDNPFLSEATRVGRVAKLEQLFNDRTANVRGQIAQAQADIETQLGLETKQFDINNEQAQLALSQFNTLLSLGALDNASGEDISAITRTTGLSSGMIQSAISANKKKNVQTSTISFDDGVNQGYVVIDSQTGEILNRQVVSQSKPTKSGGSGSGGGLTATQQRNATAEARKAISKVDTNDDKLLSKAEYTDAVRQIMIATGVDFNTADDYATSAFGDLGFKKWKW